MTGTVPLYLDWHYLWDADGKAVHTTAKDLPPGSTVLDVGANIGIMACSLAVQRPDLHIVAIEPVPDNAACLRENVKANGLTNIEIVHAAVSDRPGMLKFSVEGPWSSVRESGVEVPAITLDNFADRDVSMVKIDVEGWEPHVIAGGAGLLSRKRPLVLMEWNAICLLFAHHDPVSFAEALWGSFDMLECFVEDKPRGAPQSARGIVHDNIMEFKSVSDILMRAHAGAAMPSLDRMINPPRCW